VTTRSDEDLSVALGDIELAAARIAGVARHTPLLESPALSRRVGSRVLVKAEGLQSVGSFKIRGAYNLVSQLAPEERQRGVVAFSSGNHAQAVALAAALFGTRAVVVMPEDAPSGKLAATREYGAEVVTYDRYTEDREQIGRRLAGERGLTLVPPFDDPEIIAGQGTAALELAADAGPLDVLLAPVSGGGLIAGCAIAIKALYPDARVIGVEPETADDYRRSLATGQRVSTPVPRTIADALQVTTPGELTFEHNRRLLDGIVTVSDQQLVEAMRFCHERLKVVVEPGGVAGLAAILSGAAELRPGERAGVILSGGNVEVARFRALTQSMSV
jgi:threonine dehydratase